VDSELDLSRLAELQDLLGAQLPQIVATLLAELARALRDIDAGLGGRDLAAVARAAHDARNSALMIDAQPLLACLGELESCALGCDLTSALVAQQRVTEAWSPLRRSLQQAAAVER
jgi:hypothetical protein